MLKRKIYDELLKWKQEKNGKTALMVEGARRIGKSYSTAATTPASPMSASGLARTELP